MARHVCVVTGPVVGLRSSWFIGDTVRFARRLGKKVVAFNLFDEMLEIERLPAADAFQMARTIGELLDGYDYQFRDLRHKAYLSVSRKIDQLDEETSVILRTPAAVEWRGVLNEFKDHRWIAEYIDPDTIVTLIDAEWKIRERLKTQYGQHALNVIAHQKELDIPHILRWLGTEVSRSEDWAEWCSCLRNRDVRHLVLGIESPGPGERQRYIRDVDNMVKLVTSPGVPVFYASYSMTVATDEVRQAIHDAVWRLRQYGVVIDPASIELGDSVAAEHRDTVFAYTVCRDLRWDVQKADIVAAFHPYPDVPPLSTGMLDELGHARAFRTERYLVLPEGGGSPFTGDNYVPAEHIFLQMEDFFHHLENERQPPLKPVFASYAQKLSAARNTEQSAKRAPE